MPNSRFFLTAKAGIDRAPSRQFFEIWILGVFPEIAAHCFLRSRKLG